MSRDSGPVRVEAVDYATALPALRAVREEVFVREQRVPAALEHDALDPACLHVLARLEDGTPVATGRLAADGRIGRMAVRAPWRGQGVGAAVLWALLELAARRGDAAVHLHAQRPAQAFYARHGFRAQGEPFREAGIDHQAMALRLDGPLAVADPRQALALSARIVLSARRALWIRSQALDPGLFDRPPLLGALRRFATAGRGGEVRILLHDAAAPQRALAPLLALAQRLPSVFRFRELVDPVDREDPAAFLASDAGGYYLRRRGQPVEGEAMLAAPARVRPLQLAHADAWERARPVSEYRALGL